MGIIGATCAPSIEQTTKMSAFFGVGWKDQFNVDRPFFYQVIDRGKL